MVNYIFIRKGYDTNKDFYRPMDRGGIPVRKGGSPAGKGWEPLL